MTKKNKKNFIYNIEKPEYYHNSSLEEFLLGPERGNDGWVPLYIKQDNELSNEKLAQYKKAAGDQATAADKAGDYDKGHKRFKGIVKATNKQFDNDTKKNK